MNMEKTFKEAFMHRRSYYSITNQSPIDNSVIQDILETAIAHTPSPFNSQSARVVLLLGEHHKRLWSIVKRTLQKRLSTEAFRQTEEKIENCFASGYGTVLFFEDQSVVKGLQTKFPPYSERFPEWSLQSSGMLQLAVWAMLEDVGFGASLQHYNPIIDKEVHETFNLDWNWTLIAQMPFGVPLQKPDPKSFLPMADRLKVFK